MPETNTPTIFLIFGITGDLAQRKLLPALYHLIKDGLVHDKTRIIGLTRQNTSADELMKTVELCVLETDKTCDPEALRKFHDILVMRQFDPSNTADYQSLKLHLDEIENEQEVCMNRLYYLSIPPKVFATVVANLGKAGFAGPCQHGTGSSALLVEKPFGFDLASAQELIEDTEKYFEESQVYRIDHYLAKETAQNILTFRRHNPVFHDLWNSKHISSIEVIAYEKIGVEKRIGFYDNVGALRDLIQSHLIQLLALATMELPADFSDTGLHAAKEALLGSIEPVPESEVTERVTRGQYRGYREEIENPDSSTETYADITLSIPSERWQGTTFRLSTGKAMAGKQTMVRVTFHNDINTANQLTFRLQPNEGIDITLQVKKPGFSDETEPAVLNYDYTQAAHPDAYERVLIDAIRGDHQLFASSAEVLASWRVLQPVLDTWQHTSDDLLTYEPGSEVVGQ
jgi:glucose-6-phosphate 1-dehydrogenase